MSLMDLFRPRWKHSDCSVRKAAVAKISDQAVLAEIAKTDSDSIVSEEAFKKVSNQALLADIAKHGTWSRFEAVRKIQDHVLLADVAKAARDPSVRSRAVQKLSDQAVLADIAMTDTDCFVCEAAVASIGDQAVLAHIAMAHKSGSFTRKEAVKKLSDQAILAKIAKFDSDDEVRKEAVQKLSDQAVLADIAKTGDDFSELCLYAVRNISDPARLADVAKAARSRYARMAAVEKIRDQGVLADIAEDDSDSLVRLAAVKRLRDPATLANIADTDRDPEVCKAAFAKLAKLRIARKGPGGGSTEEVTSTLAHSKVVTAEKIARELLLGGGVDYFARVISSHCPAEIEALCEEFPIRTDLTNGLAIDNTFQAATFVAKVLADYEAYASLFNFSTGNLPWRSLSETIVSLISRHVQRYRSSDIAPIYKIQIYDLAIGLLQCKPPRNSEALLLLESSAPGVRADHSFWIFACQYNIAQKIKDRSHVDKAIKMANEILDGKVSVPGANLQGVKQMLAELQEI